MDKESLCANFPDKWEDFISQYISGADIKGEELVPLYRAKQMMWYYLRDYIKLGNAYSSEDYIIDIVPDETKNSLYGTPHFVVRRRL